MSFIYLVSKQAKEGSCYVKWSSQKCLCKSWAWFIYYNQKTYKVIFASHDIPEGVVSDNWHTIYFRGAWPVWKFFWILIPFFGLFGLFEYPQLMVWSRDQSKKQLKNYMESQVVYWWYTLTYFSPISNYKAIINRNFVNGPNFF